MKKTKNEKTVKNEKRTKPEKRIKPEKSVINDKKTKRENQAKKENNPKDKKRPEQKSAHNTVPVYRRLGVKLIASFLVPILFIIVLGFVSYNQASKAIITNYENSVEETMHMTNQYLSLAIDTVRSTYKSYLSDDDLSKYFKGLMDSSEGKGLALTYTKEVSRDVNTNDLICNISFISDDLISITSAAPTTSAPYTAYAESSEGALVVANRSSYYLFGNQCDADQSLGADPAKYSLRLAKHLTNGRAIMLIDFRLSLVTDTLASLDAGEGSYAAFITQEGTELYADGTSTKDGIFTGTDFYQAAVDSQESGMEYVTYDGDTYLFVYSPISNMSAMICALIPQSTILAQASSIKTVAMILTIVAAIIATLLGFILSAHINHNISQILKQLKRVSSGDLTIQLKNKSKDEFRLLADGVNAMIDSMKTLITNVTEAGNSLTRAAGQVSASSETFVTTAEGIQEAILEIENGVTQLDDNSADCLAQMDSLSGKINEVTKDTNEITALTESTGSSISTGISSMNTLTDSARKTSRITDEVINAIEALSEKSRSIVGIVESINAIARQTNLLSLNASIEAARAGEAGRGFAVVAEQIRLLADQSAASAGEIQKIIDDIIKNTGEVVSIAREAEATVEFQEQAVSQTTESFLNMDKQIHALLDSVAEISSNMRNMEESRNTTLNAIEGISAISAQTAAGSSNVNATVDAQREAITTLDAAAGVLLQRAEELTELLKQFTI